MDGLAAIRATGAGRSTRNLRPVARSGAWRALVSTLNPADDEGGTPALWLARPFARWLTPSRRPVVGSIAAGLYGQAVLVVTGVVVARALGPTDRGYLAFLLLLESIVRQVGGLGLSSSMAYFIARDRPHADQIVRAIRTPVLLQLGFLTFVQAGLLLIFVRDDPHRVWVAGLLTLALVPSVIGQDYALSILQGQGRFLAYNVLRSLPVSGYGVMIVFLYAIGKTSLFWITVANLVPFLVFTGLMLHLALRGLARSSPADDVPTRRQIFGFGFRGYLTALSPVETFRLDQSAIGIFLSPKALGLYVVALSFTNLPRFISASVGAIAFPRAAHDRETSGRRTMWQFTFFIAVITIAMIIPLELAAGWLVPFFFGSQFDGAIGVTRILAIGALFLAIRRVLTEGARGIGFPGLGSMAEAGSWLTLVPLLAILMPRYGLKGAASSIVISSALSLAILVVALLRARDTHSVPPGMDSAPPSLDGEPLIVNEA